ncbi:MAG: HNH endonuclease [Nitrosopumilus sp.]
MISAESVNRLLTRDTETGIFTWKFGLSHTRSGQVAGFITLDGYISIRINGRQYFAHKLVVLLETGKYPEGEIDHKDGDPANNIYSNLRVCTHSENMKNHKQYSSNTSGCNGVSAHGSRWRSRIQVDGKRISLGVFDIKEDAAKAYDEAATVYFKEFKRNWNSNKKDREADLKRLPVL